MWMTVTFENKFLLKLIYTLYSIIIKRETIHVRWNITEKYRCFSQKFHCVIFTEQISLYKYYSATQLLNDRWVRPTPKTLFYLKAIVKKVKIEFHRTRVHFFRELRYVQNQINWLINEMKYRGALFSASKLNNSYTLPAGKCIWQHVISFTFWNTFAR